MNTYLRFPDGKPKALTLSYDDGVEQDARLTELLDKYNVKATFNINSGAFAPEGTTYAPGTIHRRMSERQAVRLYAGTPHEIAAHGLTHPRLDALPLPAILDEIISDRKNLERLFDEPVAGMAYPYGTYDDRVIGALRAAGISYARTAGSHYNFSLPRDWLQLTATCHHDALKSPELLEKFLSPFPEQNPPDPWLFYVWGHSYEFERDDTWHVIEDFLAQVSNNPDVWYATNIEIYDYIEAYRNNLRYSANGDMVQNLSALSVWLNADGKGVFEIKPGETMRLL